MIMESRFNSEGNFLCLYTEINPIFCTVYQSVGRIYIVVGLISATLQ